MSYFRFGWLANDELNNIYIILTTYFIFIIWIIYIIYIHSNSYVINNYDATIIECKLDKNNNGYSL